MRGGDRLRTMRRLECSYILKLNTKTPMGLNMEYLYTYLRITPIILSVLTGFNIHGITLSTREKKSDSNV